MMRHQRGFTLLEVLIAIVIMTIAFFAVLATEVSSIQGYTSARDLSRASELGKVVVEHLQIEGGQWRRDDLNSLVDTWGATPGTDSPFDDSLPAMSSNPWVWVRLTHTPVDERLARGPNVLNEKYCVYGRGGYLPFDTTGQNNVDASGANPILIDSPLFQAQVAIVYTSPTADPLTTCPDGIYGSAGSDNIYVDLNPADATRLESLELNGLRASFFGTLVQRREWLQ